MLTDAVVEVQLQNGSGHTRRATRDFLRAIVGPITVFALAFATAGMAC